MLIMGSIACVVSEERVAENAVSSTVSTAMSTPAKVAPQVVTQSAPITAAPNPTLASEIVQPKIVTAIEMPAIPEGNLKDTAVGVPPSETEPVAVQSATEAVSPSWGEVITGTPPIYATSDIDQSTIDLTAKWYKVATDAWGNYGPTEIYIIGTDIEAARKVEDDFCDRHKKLDSGWKTEWDCANANYELFTRYAKEGSAGVSTYNRDYLDYYFTTVTLSSHRPSPDEEDYKVIIMHEYFHVYQHAHISDTEKNDEQMGIWGDKSGRESKMGGTAKPWFAEGTAEFFAQLLYSRQPGVRANYLEEIMTRKYTSSVNGYLEYDKGLKDLSYADPIGCSWGDECWFHTYDVGTWFIAYLVDQVGEETVIVDYYKDLDSLGFEGAFLKHFKKSSDEMVKDFDMFLAGGLNEALKILP